MSLGPFAPRALECPKSVPRVSPECQKRCPAPSGDTLGRLFGHSGARDSCSRPGVLQHSGKEKGVITGLFTGGVSGISKISQLSRISRKWSNSPLFSTVRGSLEPLESLNSLESLEKFSEPEIPCAPSLARRDILMLRSKNCREANFESQLSRNYPHRGGKCARGKKALSCGGETARLGGIVGDNLGEGNCESKINCLETMGRQFLPRDIKMSRRPLWATK